MDNPNFLVKWNIILLSFQKSTGGAIAPPSHSPPLELGLIW